MKRENFIYNNQDIGSKSVLQQIIRRMFLIFPIIMFLFLNSCSNSNKINHKKAEKKNRFIKYIYSIILYRYYILFINKPVFFIIHMFIFMTKIR